MRTFTRSNGLLGEHAMMDRVEGEIQQLVDRESEAWNNRDAEALVEILHPDMILPWPPDAQSHDPATWVMPMGRYNRQRWKHSWEELFRSHDLIHNERETVRIVVSAEGDAAFAVVDVDTLWRHRANGADFHWKGRACKGYSKVDDCWLLIFQTGLLDYGGLENA